MAFHSYDAQAICPSPLGALRPLVAFALDRAGSSRGPAMGTFTAVTDLGVGIGAAMMGLILNWTNYPTMFLCLALISVINLLYFHFFIRKKGGDRYANL